MHHLFINVSEEIDKGKRQIHISDPFVESVVGFEEFNILQNSANQDEEQEIQEKKKQISTFDVKPLLVQTFLFKDESLILNEELKRVLQPSVVYIVALPETFDHEGFLDYALKLYLAEVNEVRILLETHKRKKSVIIYFKEKVAAQSFTEEYNCHVIDEIQEEFMLVIFLASVTFLRNISFMPVAMEEQHKFNLQELPTCPLCIEKLESSISGVTLLPFMSLAIYEHPDRWKQVKDTCLTCSAQFSSSQCVMCGETEGLWACLVCGNIGCGRYKKGHAKEHWYQSGHCLSMEAESERVWDYYNDTFVHRLMKGENKKTIILNANCGKSETNVGNSHMQVWSSEDDKGETSDRVDNAIWEYCYVISHQMEEQRKYFEKKIEEVQKQNSNIQTEGLTQTQEIQAQIKEIQIKREKNQKLRDGCSKKKKTILEKNAEMEDEIERLLLFSQGVTQNIKQLENTDGKQENELSDLDIAISQESAKLEQLDQHLLSLYDQLSQ